MHSIDGDAILFSSPSGFETSFPLLLLRFPVWVVSASTLLQGAGYFVALLSFQEAAYREPVHFPQKQPPLPSSLDKRPPARYTIHKINHWGVSIWRN